MNTILIRKTSDPFARVPKSLLDDDRLSWKAKGILAYLLGKKDGWRANTSDIEKHGCDGRDAVRAGLKEIIKLGYGRWCSERGDDGKLSGRVLVVSDTPAEETLEPSDGENRQTENPSDGKPVTNKNDREVRTRESKNEVLTLPSLLDGADACEEIYALFPKKIAKPKALEAIRKAVRKHGFMLVKERTARFAKDHEGADLQYVPYPQRWFNEERFLEDWVKPRVNRQEIWNRITILRDKLKVHPGNPEFTGSNLTTENVRAFEELRLRLKDLETQYAL